MSRTLFGRKVSAVLAMAMLFVALPAVAQAQSGTAGYTGNDVDEIITPTPEPTVDGLGPTIAGEVEESNPPTVLDDDASGGGSDPCVEGAGTDGSEDSGGSGLTGTSGAECVSASNEAGANTPTASTSSTSSGDELPFTGYDAGLIALLGAALIGTGFVLRRTVRRRTTL